MPRPAVVLVSGGLDSATVLAIVVGKAAMTAVPALLAGYPPRTSLLAGAVAFIGAVFVFVL